LVAILCALPMSSFQLYLSDLTLGAKERLARLDAAGGALWARLLSPMPGDGAAIPLGLQLTSGTAGSVAVHFAPVVQDSVSAERVVALGVGVSGKFSVARGVTGGLTSFVMMLDLLESLCCGAVAGGV
jgi:hypothetical protein